ncbi:dUTP diphosphatase [Candidatus Woesearchaeota archaeon]|nr:dUTP diphosphatase [Candidatus Woesearchaeota archaeon]
MEVKITKIKDNATIPAYAKPGDAGVDLCSTESYTIKPGERELISTGIKIALPDGYEAQVRPRSGLAIKNGISIVNTPGTIDSGYRGEIGVILINHGKEDFVIEPGMRIAQMIINKFEHVSFKEVEELDETERGEGGFGHSGHN